MKFQKALFSFAFLLLFTVSNAQWKWKNVDSAFQPLPPSMHVYLTQDATEGKPNLAYYVSVDLKDRSVAFTTQVGNGKRYTPSQFFEQEQKPLLVMNTTFFEFVKNSNLNIVIKEGHLLAYQVNTFVGKGKDTLTYRHVFASAIGIDKRRKADIAWLYTDSAERYAYATQQVINVKKDAVAHYAKSDLFALGTFKKWKMQTAVGGGPVLVQNGIIQITNNEELKFAGKAINDKHPRSAMGYTPDGRLILLAIEGRFPGKAEGATLVQEAQMLQQIGCIEALNLDGGGSSCLLVNGKQTITPSDKEGQRAVPAVFIIKN